MKRVLLVCLGNICRSAMAEGILRTKAKAKNIPLAIDSGGTSNFHTGEAPDKRAQATMLKKGIDISDLRARQFKSEDFEKFDYILAMDKQNYYDLVSKAQNEAQKQKVALILSYLNSNDFEEVPDPYYGGDEGFELVYSLLDEACENFLNKINE
ncbi:MAG: low molecular weight protein-tyrosine-phosphatase [Vicingaceae bacterium]